MAIKDEMMTRKKLTNKQKKRRAYGRNFNLTGKAKGPLTGEYQVQKDTLIPTNINLANAQQFGPMGSATTQYNPETGQVEYRQSLAPEMQNIYNQGAGLTDIGQDKAKQQLQGYQQFNFNEGDTRANMENQVFASLTRGLEDNYALERERKQSELVNRGIPMDMNNPVFRAEMEALDRRFDDQRINARGQAAQMAGSEVQNAYQRGLGTHQQSMGDINALQSQGTGLLLPQFQGYQGTEMQLSNPTDIKFQKRQMRQNQQQLDQQNQYQMGMLGVAQMNANTAARRPSGGGAPVDDFNE